MLDEEGGGGLRHAHAHAHAHVHVHVCCMCDVLAGAAWADLLYTGSLLYIPLYIKLLYKAENRCIRCYTLTRVAGLMRRV